MHSAAQRNAIPKANGRKTVAKPDGGQSQTCHHCDGTGEIWESCGCYQCEYDSHHSRYVECANCDGSGRAA